MRGSICLFAQGKPLWGKACSTVCSTFETYPFLQFPAAFLTTWQGSYPGTAVGIVPLLPPFVALEALWLCWAVAYATRSRNVALSPPPSL